MQPVQGLPPAVKASNLRFLDLIEEQSLKQEPCLVSGPPSRNASRQNGTPESTELSLVN